MIESIKNWYLARSPRERRLLAIAAVLGGLVVAVYGILLPAMAAISSAEKELDAAIERRGRIEARAELPGKKPVPQLASAAQLPAGLALEAVVRDSAAATGLEIVEGAANGPDGFSFRLASVKAGPLLAWLSRLAEQGVETSEIRLRKGEGGFVAADVTLARRR